MPQTEGTRVPAAAAIPIHGALTPRAETGGNRFVTRYDAIASHPIPSQTGHGLVALPRSSAGERASTEHVEQAPRVRRLLTHTHAYMRAQAHGRPHTRTTHANTHARSRTHTRSEIHAHVLTISHTRARTHTHTETRSGVRKQVGKLRSARLRDRWDGVQDRHGRGRRRMVPPSTCALP